MNDYLIAGVDGGGTKTESLVSDSKGKILGRGISGPSNPRNQGLETAAANIEKSLKKAVGRKKARIKAVFIGLAAEEEEYGNRVGKMRRLLMKGILSEVPQKNIFFGSDQESAFRSGTDELDGMVVIAGTGCVVRGWKGKAGAKAGGWGYLADEGSAFWTGQRAYQVIAKDLDGRGPKTIISRQAAKLIRFDNMEDLNKNIYTDPAKTVPLFSIAINESAKKGDKTALAILEEGSEELAIGVITVARKLAFKKHFPLVVSGGMFKSKTFESFFRKKIKKVAPFARFIVPAEIPAFGSLKLAMEKINENKIKRSR